MSNKLYTMHCDTDERPKAGDLLSVPLGLWHERTWILCLVLPGGKARTWKVLRVRWWEIEPRMRMALWRRAERHGGQTVWRYRSQKRRRSIQDIIL